MSEESLKALIKEADRWQKAYRRVRDEHANLEERFQRYVELMHDTGKELVDVASLLGEHNLLYTDEVTKLKKLGQKMQESG